MIETAICALGVIGLGILFVITAPLYARRKKMEPTSPVNLPRTLEVFETKPEEGIFGLTHVNENPIVEVNLYRTLNSVSFQDRRRVLKYYAGVMPSWVTENLKKDPHVVYRRLEMNILQRNTERIVRDAPGLIALNRPLQSASAASC